MLDNDKGAQTMTFRISVEGYNRLLNKLGSLSRLGQALGPVLREGAETFRDYLAEYPPINRAYPLAWASERQRRWYFANRRKDNLPLQYTRNSDAWSQRLGPSWATRTEGGGLRVVIGNKATYAPYVQDAAMQTQMHRNTGWHTVGGAILTKGAEVARAVTDYVRRLVNQ